MILVVGCFVEDVVGSERAPSFHLLHLSDNGLAMRHHIIKHMQTTSKNNSASTSVSVLMINAQGIMLSVLGHDYFLSYNRIPWMQDAPIRSVLNVQMSGPEAIEWPDLDVDLEIDSLRHPERYPLVIKRNELDFVGM